MNKQTHPITILIIVLACILAIGWGTYRMAEFKAERYNENLGTHYTAIDILLGVHKTARDWR
jgi:hypothetical protein